MSFNNFIFLVWLIESYFFLSVVLSLLSLKTFECFIKYILIHEHILQCEMLFVF